MAATAYASLVSLLNTLDLIHIHPLVSPFFDLHQNTSLSEKVNFLVDFVDKYSDADSREVEDLVRRISDAADEAENMVEVYVADRVRGRGESMSILPDLQKIMEEMDSIKEEVIKVKDEIEKSCSFLPDMPPSSSSSSAAPPRAADEATAMMGFDDYKRKLLDDVLGYDVDRQIISITGMGGIGKTTLARNLYENPVVVRHFNVRVWVTVSQDASARRVFCEALSCLEEALSCLEGGSVDWDMANDQQLSDKLYKALYNRRYLIILDDVWSVEIWDKIKFFFPQNNNRSRIVVTTRESKLVDCIGSSAVPIGFLDKKCSWKLFCEKTFPQQDFPPELEAVGKKIVKKCGGLPLAISVIGGLLIKSPRTQQYWEQVEENRSLILNSGENKLSSILYLSYKYLPICLKPCFLLFGLYPEDYEMDEFRVISHWIAEGLIKANKSQSLEEVAKSYINQLVGRNLLLLVSSSSQSWRRYSTHDIVRDLCLEIGEKENFYRVRRSIDGSHHFITDQTMAARFYHDQESHASKTASIIHPLIVRQESRVVPIKTRLLRVLLYVGETPYFDALQEVNMRCLQRLNYGLNHQDALFSSLSLFWSLQTLVLRLGLVKPIEIWKMPQLRHIDISFLYLPNPPPSDEEFCVLENLHTLRKVQNLIFTEKVCKRIPNIKVLEIHYVLSRAARGASPCYHLENLGSFNKLEVLYFYCQVPVCCAGYSSRSIKFPSSLKKLTLNGCELEWNYMAVVASLPHLEYLHIKENAIVATKWVFVDEKFVSLKVLNIIFHSHLRKWIANSSNFPVLEHLCIGRMRKLSKIPSGIGEIPTLRSIDLYMCRESANISAVKILHEQERFGNLGLQVQIKTYVPELLREKVQDLGFTCENLVIDCEYYHLISPS